MTVNLQPNDDGMKNWVFRQDSMRRWYWSASEDDDSCAVSHRAFDTRASCVEDAMEHGYVPEESHTGQTHTKKNTEYAHCSSRNGRRRYMSLRGFAISTTKLPGGATGAIALLSNPARFAALTHPHKVE
jgi:hypothetical protein